jgi:hypothetical protein
MRPLFLLLSSALSLLATPREELLTATLQGAPEEHETAIRFLIEHMPERDLTAIKPEYLRENTALAFKARATFPFAKDIPEDIFLNDVLPYATLDESRDDWRADFMKRFGKIAGDAKTPREAVTRINAAIKDETGVEYNTKRRAANQGPTESINLKMASCTGLSILLVDALRSVGLPARIAGTAMWTTKPGNHNWVEIWLPDAKTWLFTEYYLDSKGFDHGWLVPDAARGIPGSTMHGIFATSWKKTGKHFPLVWAINDTSVPGIDVSERYIALGKDSLPQIGECELRIDVLDGAGKRIAIPVEVRQADVKIASGESPKPTDDLNRHFTIKVKQGQLYQVYAIQDEKPVAMEQLEIGGKEEARQVTLKLKP